MKYLVISRVDTKEGHISPEEVDTVIGRLRGVIPTGTKYTYHEGFGFDPGDRKIWLELGQGAGSYVPVVEGTLGVLYAVDTA